MKMKLCQTFIDPAVKAHVRRLLSPGQPSNNEESNIESSKDIPENKGNVEGGKSDATSEVSSADSPTPMLMSATTTTRSNGSCSDASVSSELEALLPSTMDRFKEEERSQWEPLAIDEKFARQKNTPRYRLDFGFTQDVIQILKHNPSCIKDNLIKIVKKYNLTDKRSKYHISQHYDIIR